MFWQVNVCNASGAENAWEDLGVVQCLLGPVSGRKEKLGHILWYMEDSEKPTCAKQMQTSIDKHAHTTN